MEPTPEGAGTGARTGERDVELTELTPTAVQRHPTRVAFATPAFDQQPISAVAEGEAIAAV